VNVRDNGYGIPPERLEILFQMFRQVPEHRALVGDGGLGIGLGLSRQLIELHGGSVTARSEGLGRGSEFVVHLPLARSAEREEVKVRGENTEQPSPHRRMLVVDDNVDAADSLSMVLDALGHSVKAAYEGATALELMDSFAPEVVLLDIGLPEMDGLEVARRIRARPDGEAVRLIALTGWGQDEDKRRTQEAGFDEHLTKPVDAVSLATLIGR
jgi:CheY-like chemotaxis protein